MFNKWETLKVTKSRYGSYSVTEVKCPKCGYRETFTTRIPKWCYGCGEVNYSETENG